MWFGDWQFRVLSRGIGSLEFIQRSLIPEDRDDDEGPQTNQYGSPIRCLTVTRTPRTHTTSKLSHGLSATVGV